MNDALRLIWNTQGNGILKKKTYVDLAEEKIEVDTIEGCVKAKEKAQKARLKLANVEYIGEIAYVKGKVIIERGIDLIPATVGMQLKQGDVINPEVGAEARAYTIDNGIIEVYDNGAARQIPRFSKEIYSSDNLAATVGKHLFLVNTPPKMIVFITDMNY